MAVPAAAGPRMRPVQFMTEDGLQIRGSFWEARGEGAISLLLVHDRNAERRVWDPYVRFFLSRGWSVLTFDLRGHGESVRQEMRTALPQAPYEEGWPLDVRAALAFLSRQPKADPAKRAIVGLGLGADLAYAASGSGWGASSVVCVSPDDARARTFAGPGPLRPRGVYLLYGALDPAGSATSLAIASSAVFPAECEAYPGTASAGLELWEERQPDIVARSIAWIERTI